MTHRDDVHSVKLFLCLGCVPFLSFVKTNKSLSHYCNCNIDASSEPSQCMLICNSLFLILKGLYISLKMVKMVSFMLCLAQIIERYEKENNNYL